MYVGRFSDVTRFESPKQSVTPRLHVCWSCDGADRSEAGADVGVRRQLRHRVRSHPPRELSYSNIYWKVTFFYCADSSDIHTYTGRHVYYNDSYIWVSDIQPGFFLHCDWSFSLSVRLKKGGGGVSA